MSSLLQKIIAHKYREIEGLQAPHPERLRPSDRDFRGALAAPGRSIIAEMKAASPSSGPLCRDYDPPTIAQTYERGGAAALSVLTDGRFFEGHPSHLVQARLASTLPILRKDFIVDGVQVARSRFMGADACLLIVAALKPAALVELETRCADLGMDAVVEVHDERELDVALQAGAGIIGINNRNLDDLSIDTDITTRLCTQIPDDVVVVGESGFDDPAAVQALPERVDAVLIGTALMLAEDPRTFLRQAVGVLESRT